MNDELILEQSHLSEGPVSIHLPKLLSEESIAELEYWLVGILRRAERRAGIKRMPLCVRTMSARPERKEHEASIGS